MAHANVLELNNENFAATVQGDKLVVADFWAPWCGPCRQLTPVIDAIATKYADKVTVAKVNVDDNQELAIKYDVQTIPRILMFKGSETPIDVHVGVLSEAELSKKIDAKM